MLNHKLLTAFHSYEQSLNPENWGNRWISTVASLETALRLPWSAQTAVVRGPVVVSWSSREAPGSMAVVVTLQ